MIFLVLLVSICYGDLRESLQAFEEKLARKDPQALAPAKVLLQAIRSSESLWEENQEKDPIDSRYQFLELLKKAPKEFRDLCENEFGGGAKALFEKARAENNAQQMIAIARKYPGTEYGTRALVFMSHYFLDRARFELAKAYAKAALEFEPKEKRALRLLAAASKPSAKVRSKSYLILRDSEGIKSISLEEVLWFRKTGPFLATPFLSSSAHGVTAWLESKMRMVGVDSDSGITLWEVELENKTFQSPIFPLDDRLITVVRDQGTVAIEVWDRRTGTSIDTLKFGKMAEESVNILWSEGKIGLVSRAEIVWFDLCLGIPAWRESRKKE